MKIPKNYKNQVIYFDIEIERDITWVEIKGISAAYNKSIYDWGKLNEKYLDSMRDRLGFPAIKVLWKPDQLSTGDLEIWAVREVALAFAITCSEDLWLWLKDTLDNLHKTPVDMSQNDRLLFQCLTTGLTAALDTDNAADIQFYAELLKKFTLKLAE